mmetsp:Transcript_15133/g.51058  ORF Transcript_15133/g.51058 Transcript_15133/m.51058 type:complete len:243 (+) Transcript_15133:716-1444(+)
MEGGTNPNLAAGGRGNGANTHPSRRRTSSSAHPFLATARPGIPSPSPSQPSLEVLPASLAACSELAGLLFLSSSPTSRRVTTLGSPSRTFAAQVRPPTFSPLYGGWWCLQYRTFSSSAGGGLTICASWRPGLSEPSQGPGSTTSCRPTPSNIRSCCRACWSCADSSSSLDPTSLRGGRGREEERRKGGVRGEGRGRGTRRSFLLVYGLTNTFNFNVLLLPPEAQLDFSPFAALKMFGDLFQR